MRGESSALAKLKVLSSFPGCHNLPLLILTQNVHNSALMRILRDLFKQMPNISFLGHKMTFLQLKRNHFTEIHIVKSHILTLVSHKFCEAGLYWSCTFCLASFSHHYIFTSYVILLLPIHSDIHPILTTIMEVFLAYILSFSLISKSNIDQWSLMCQSPIMACIGKLYCGVCQVCQCNWEAEESQLDQVLRITLQTIE